MSTAKEIEIALYYLQSECYKAGYPETGYLVEVARLSLEDAKRIEKAKAKAEAEKLLRCYRAFEAECKQAAEKAYQRHFGDWQA